MEYWDSEAERSKTTIVCSIGRTDTDTSQVRTNSIPSLSPKSETNFYLTKFVFSLLSKSDLRQSMTQTQYSVITKSKDYTVMTAEAKSHFLVRDHRGSFY